MKKPNLKLKRLRRGKKAQASDNVPATVPRITNETIAAHREEVIGSARKYIYPLQHSKHRIVLISTGLLIAAIIGFFAYCTIAIYRFQSTSTFIYRVSQVIPFPVARAGGTFVSYESYLFEVRQYQHYYENQLKTNFNDPKNKPQLDAYKKQALDQVVNDAYIKKLAQKYGVTVTEQQVNDQITILRNQNRLGSSDRVFEDVLKDYWGWSVDDFKRSLREQLLAQNVVAKLDSTTTDRANQAYAELQAGGDFAAIAKKYSDDPGTKDAGGDLGVVERTKRDLTAQTVDAIYKLKPGQYSPVINIGYSLEIVKNLETTPDGKVHAAHILFQYKPIDNYLNDMKDKQKARVYIQ